MTDFGEEVLAAQQGRKYDNISGVGPEIPIGDFVAERVSVMAEPSLSAIQWMAFTNL